MALNAQNRDVLELRRIEVSKSKQMEWSITDMRLCISTNLSTTFRPVQLNKLVIDSQEFPEAVIHVNLIEA